MSRLRGRVDENQPGIVADLRKCGATVEVISNIGCGCPDILVGFGGRCWIFEIKMPGKALTPDEAKWSRRWRGQWNRIETAEEALRIMGITGGTGERRSC